MVAQETATAEMYCWKIVNYVAVSYVSARLKSSFWLWLIRVLLTPMYYVCQTRILSQSRRVNDGITLALHLLIESLLQGFLETGNNWGRLHGEIPATFAEAHVFVNIAPVVLR